MQYRNYCARVALCTKFFIKSGGRELFVEGLVNGLSRLNVDQSVVTTTSEVIRARETLENVDVLRKSRVFPSSAYVILRGLYELFRDDRFDLIHIHGYGEYAADLACFMRRMGILDTPLILTTHGIAGLMHGIRALDLSLNFSPAERIRRTLHLGYDLSLGRLEMSTFDRVVLLSNEEEHYLQKIGLGSKRIVRIPVAINDIFHKSNTSEMRSYVLYVGRIDRHKGLRTLVYAIRELKVKGEKVKCIIVGEDFGYKSELVSLIHDLNLEDLIEVRGPVPQEELVPLYESALVTVLLSTSEGFPASLAESLAVGIPFISTPVGAITELSNKTQAGILVTPEDHVGVASAIAKLRVNHSLWREMSSNGKKYSSTFSWRNVASLYRELYEEVSRS